MSVVPPQRSLRPRGIWTRSAGALQYHVLYAAGVIQQWYNHLSTTSGFHQVDIFQGWSNSLSATCSVISNGYGCPLGVAIHWDEFFRSIGTNSWSHDASEHQVTTEWQQKRQNSVSTGSSRPKVAHICCANGSTKWPATAASVSTRGVNLGADPVINLETATAYWDCGLRLATDVHAL